MCLCLFSSSLFCVQYSSQGDFHVNLAQTIRQVVSSAIMKFKERRLEHGT